MSRSLLVVALVVALMACGETTATQPPEARPASPTPGAPGPTAPDAPATEETAQPEPTPTPTPSPTPTPTPGQPVRVGTFDAQVIPGASGLAVGQRDPDVLWLLDDRPGTAEVWAVRRDGEILGAVAVEGLDALDTESLAIGPCGPEGTGPCLYVGDIGDNLRSRADITVHRFPEPDLSDGIPTAPVAADVIRLQHPDSPQDAEALLIDADGVPFLVTKARFDRESRTTGEARLRRAPGFADGVLEDLGEVAVPVPEQPLQSLLVGNVVTGGEAIEGRVLLRTYDQVLEYTGEGGLADLPGWEVRSLPAPFELQPEAVGIDADGCGYLTVGEGAGDIWLVACS